ncbi:MAG: aminotransferase class I/II-fold pyridoxal phosphate-dependent enzyme, partial [Clostridiaceae bacterium]|nr:aminotransferase class I/II-fold pyridoxal phosphate-dependent enzyme [Clostridiaceae bacterium]
MNKTTLSQELALNGGKPVRSTPLPAAYPGADVYSEEEKQAVMAVIEHKSPYRYYGPDVLNKVKSFEKDLARLAGCKNALGVTSGTASLVVALKAAGIGPGDKVIVPACTFIATVGAVIIAGAVPVFADVDESMSLDPAAIDALADRYTKAVMPVHLLGNPCDMDNLMAAARRHNLIVIEDDAQSFGSSYKGHFCGSIGD